MPAERACGLIVGSAMSIGALPISPMTVADTGRSTKDPGPRGNIKPARNGYRRYF